jgi:formylglycine-generating enzyme required for sulfatase activity
MKCPECKNEVPADSKFCNHCGNKVEVIKTNGKNCPYCKRDGLPSEALYCPDCGREINLAKSGLQTITASLNNNKPDREDENQTKNFIEAVNGISFRMIEIQGGTFQMGTNDPKRSDAEKPIHSVTLKSFYLGETLVTQDLWRVVYGDNKSLIKTFWGENPGHFKGHNLPVENVTWYQVQDFIKILSSTSGKKYRLPTEAEWEYAAGGGKAGKTLWSGTNTFMNSFNPFKSIPADDLTYYCWYSSNSNEKTHPVGNKKSNSLGLFDMSGNVIEWCQDWYAGYTGFDQNNPQGASTGSEKVARGGSYSEAANDCHITSRYGIKPGNCSVNVGFRLALDL